MVGSVDLLPVALRRAFVLGVMVPLAFAAVAMAQAGRASAAPPSGAIGLAVDASGPATGAPLLRARVTNASPLSCGLAAIGDLTVSVVEATRDGSPILPTYVRSLPNDGASAGVANRTSMVASGATVAFDLRTGDGNLPVSVGLDDGSMLVGLYSLREPGRYELRLTYAMPPSAFTTSSSTAACTGMSDPATVAFTVAAPGSAGRGGPWLWIAVAGVMLVAVLILVLWMRARTRRRGGRAGAAATAVAFILVASLGGVVLDGVSPAPAHAGVIYGPLDPSSDPTTYQEYTNCISAITAFDPALMQALNQVKVTVYPIPGGEPQTLPSQTGGPRDSTIEWDPERGTGFKGETSGAVYEPCPALYHELNHARDRATDSDTSQECDDTGVLVDEVRATLAENRFRAAQKPPLPPRTTYDGKKIPNSLDGCTPPKLPPDQRIASNDPDVCRGIDGPCGGHTGDPHIFTFDGYRFDLQAVGEFVAVHSSAGDMDIQVRQSPFPGSRTVAVDTAVAMRVAGLRLGFYLDHGSVVVRRDGAVVDIPIGTSNLAGGAKINHVVDPARGHSYAVVWPDGSAAWVSQASSWGLSLNVQPRLARTGTLTGLLGPFNGDKSDDLSTVDGRKLAQPPSFDDLYHTYAQGWRVTDTDSLFDYATGTSTRDFTDLTFPDKPAAVNSLPAGQRDSAGAACTLLGVTDPTSFDECVIDVANTGQAIFAVDSARAQAAAGLDRVGVRAGTGSIIPAQTLTVTTAGGQASMSFHGTAGQSAYIQVTATTLPGGCGVPQLVAPDSTTLAIGCLSGGKGSIDSTPLPATGTYLVRVRPQAGATGTITMRVILSTDATAPITPDGPAASETVTFAGQRARLTFAASAGERVFIDVLSTSLPPNCGTLYVAPIEDTGSTGPATTLGCTSADGTGFIDTTTLATAGTYAVVLDPAADTTGNATVKVITVHDQRLTITPDGPPVTATVTGTGGKSYLAFNATAGEKVFVDIISASVAPGCGTVSVAIADGPGLALGCIDGGGKGYVDTTTLPNAGTYAVVVDPPARGVGAVTVKLTVVHDQQQAITLNGEAATATIPQAGAQSTLTFNATAGQKVTVSGSGATAGLDGCGTVVLRAPGGGAVAAGCVNADGTLTFTSDPLPTTGTYVVVVDPPARNTGSIALRVHT